MLEFLQKNIATILVGAAVLALVVLVVRHLIKEKKHSACGGGCGGCGGSCGCGGGDEGEEGGCGCGGGCCH